MIIIKHFLLSLVLEQQATTTASPAEFSLCALKKNSVKTRFESLFLFFDLDQSNCKPCVTTVTTDDLFARQQQCTKNFSLFFS